MEQITINTYAGIERSPRYNKKGKVQNVVYGIIDALCVIYFTYSGVCIVLCCSLKNHARNSLREIANAERSFNFILYQGQIPKGEVVK